MQVHEDCGCSGKRRRWVFFNNPIIYIVISFLFISISHARPSWHRSSGLKKKAVPIVAVTNEKSQTNDTLKTPSVVVPQISPYDHILPLSDESIDITSLTLDDCIDLALRRNKQIIASDYNINAAQAKLTEANALFWPVMEYRYRMAPAPKDVSNAFNTFFDGQVTLFNSMHIGIGVPLMTFGQLRTAKQMAKRGVNAAVITSQAQRREIIYKVKQVYYGLQLANETLGLIAEARGKLNSRIRSEENKEHKTMAPFDILQMKVFLNELNHRYFETEQHGKMAFEGLKALLDLPPDSDPKLDTLNLSQVKGVLSSKDDFVARALQNQKESQLIDVGVNVKELMVKLEKYKLMPHAGIGIFADIGRSTGEIAGLSSNDDFNDPFNYTRAGVGFELKGTLDFHGGYARIKKAKVDYLKSLYEGVIAKRGLSMQMKDAFNYAMRMNEEVHLAKKSVTYARQMIFLSKVNSDMGIGEASKYADGLKLYLVSQGKYYKAIYDYNVAIADLEKRAASGVLLDKPKSDNDLFSDEMSVDDEFDNEFIMLEE